MNLQTSSGGSNTSDMEKEFKNRGNFVFFDLFLYYVFFSLFVVAILPFVQGKTNIKEVVMDLKVALNAERSASHEREVNLKYILKKQEIKSEDMKQKISEFSDEIGRNKPDFDLMKELIKRKSEMGILKEFINKLYVEKLQREDDMTMANNLIGRDNPDLKHYIQQIKQQDSIIRELENKNKDLLDQLSKTRLDTIFTVQTVSLTITKLKRYLIRGNSITL